MRTNSKQTIQDMQSLAKSKGGICWSKEYVNNKTKLWWECREKHRWQATPFSVKVRNSWCPVCANNLPIGLKEMQKLAKTKKGACLSKQYINVKTKLLWQCKRGHRFEATPDTIRKGQWCQKCTQNK